MRRTVLVIRISKEVEITLVYQNPTLSSLVERELSLAFPIGLDQFPFPDKPATQSKLLSFLHPIISFQTRHLT